MRFRDGHYVDLLQQVLKIDRLKSEIHSSGGGDGQPKQTVKNDKQDINSFTVTEKIMDKIVSRQKYMDGRE